MGDSYSKLFVDESEYESEEESENPENIENKVPFKGPMSDSIENNVPFKGPTSDSIVNSVISEFISRSNVGLEKYGTTLDREDLSLLDWVQHAQEELMDGILYLEKIKKTQMMLSSEVSNMERKSYL